MASDTGVPNEGMDERLVAARDSVLNEGEKIVAQEEGDQGHGVVLTDSRVLVIKVGITATGTPKGTMIGQFPIGDITAVNVRRGPLGGVIQVCANRGECGPAHGAPPDNVAVFTGPQRMKKCEVIAAMIESAIGKPVSRTEPKPAEAGQPAPITSATAVPEEPLVPEAPPVLPEAEASASPEPRRKGGRQPSSLADEIFAEMADSRQKPVEPKPERPVSESAPTPVTEAEPVQVAVPTDASTTEEQETDSDGESPEYLPNPNLPQPVRRSRGRERVLVLFGTLVAVLVMGVAVTAPMRVKNQPPALTVPNRGGTDNVRVLREQLASVGDYLATCRRVVQDAERFLVTFDAALKSGGRTEIAAATKGNTVDRAWRKLSTLKPPRGLAGARDQMVSGMFIAKNAVANVAGAIQSSSAVDTGQTLARTKEARALIQKGLSAILNMQAELQSKGQSHRAQSVESKPIGPKAGQ